MKYIVAVSGGIDSVALLHMLRQHMSHEIVVAHVDHGIRPESGGDARFVEQLAQDYGLRFETTQLGLGANASEAVARQARYEWLERVRTTHGAQSIITAHHQDDVLETIILNLMRGTGWRGLASLRSTDGRYRPLLHIPKATLTRYAIDHQLEWREDATNHNTRYTRNYIRHMIVPQLSTQTRQQLLELARHQSSIRQRIEDDVAQTTADYKDEIGLSRYQLIMTPDSVALEVLRHATNGVEPVQLRRLLHFARIGRQGAILQLGNGKTALLTRQRLIV
ncbi:MAG TPA: tRNA lysidine(34) synthetase TilS [Candidatus Saccharibacteria bacterium]|nr:tRNA lysidine(34) synthetase TilS [Candidatus Saccharibacteria bacterium]